MGQWVNNLACLCGGAGSVSNPSPWVKDLTLPQLQFLAWELPYVASAAKKKSKSDT